MTDPIDELAADIERQVVAARPLRRPVGFPAPGCQRPRAQPGGDPVTRLLAGDGYDKLVCDACGTDHEWKIGIAP